MAAGRNQTSLTDRLTLAIIAVATLLLGEFLGIYLSSRQFLLGLSELHDAQQFTLVVGQLRVLSSAMTETLAKPGLSPQAIDSSRRVFLGIHEKFATALEEALPYARKEPRFTAYLEQTRSSLDQVRSTALSYYTALRASPSAYPDRLVATQLLLDLSEILSKLRIEIDDKSTSTFLAVYGGRYRPILIGVLLTLLFVFLSAWVGHSWVRQLQRSLSNLMAATREIARGNLSYRAPILSRDEIGAITRAFNGMVDALRESTISKRYLEATLESIPDALIVTDTEGRILQANRVAFDLLGCPESAIRSQSASILFPENGGVDLTAAALQKAGTIVSRETLLGLPGKTPVPVSLSASLVRGDGGSPRSIVCVAKDISAQKRAEEQIRQSRDRLDRLAHQLEERNTALTAANKELEAFSYSVSHDLRAPLRSADGFSKALLEEYSDRLDDQARDYLGRIRASAQRMARLIDDLLNLSRLGRKELTIETVDLSALARKAAEELAAGDPGRNVRFIISEGLVAEGDRELLRVVIENLFNNAWKFTSKHSSAMIEFGVRQQEGSPVFFVRDDGAGFDMAHAQKLFGAFQRLHRPNEFPGTGVGLATVQRIVHRHGGHAWAEGKVEKGATFYFSLRAPLPKDEHQVSVEVA
ncbi:MAG: ATP-binding protein [Oligoflexia bacterium]|nr:ATP-binding protein [Oligoflexia bacterium]